MFKLSAHLLFACYLAISIGSLGCQSTSEIAKENDGHEHGHDHHHSDVSLTFQNAVVELKSIHEQIRNAIDNNDPELAHHPLHEVSELLEALPGLAADTDLAESEWGQVKAEAERLLEAFGKIDAAFHKQDGDKKAAYKEAKEPIEKGITALESMLASSGGQPIVADHNASHHEGDHHDDEHHDDEE